MAAWGLRGQKGLRGSPQDPSTCCDPPPLPPHGPLGAWAWFPLALPTADPAGHGWHHQTAAMAARSGRVGQAVWLGLTHLFPTSLRRDLMTPVASRGQIWAGQPAGSPRPAAMHHRCLQLLHGSLGPQQPWLCYALPPWLHAAPQANSSLLSPFKLPRAIPEPPRSSLQGLRHPELGAALSEPFLPAHPATAPQGDS